MYFDLLHLNIDLDLIIISSKTQNIINTKIRTKQMSGGRIAQVVFKPLWNGGVF